MRNYQGNNYQGNNADIARQLEQLKKEIEQLKAQRGTQDSANNWLTYGEFSRRNGIGRARIYRLIAAGKIICDKTLGERAFMYKWA